nr:hypothetical protein [Tanacetum cinerariifolium]
SSEESVRTSTSWVILFGTIPTAIPATVPIIDPPVVHDDTPLTPTETPTIPHASIDADTTAAEAAAAREADVRVKVGIRSDGEDEAEEEAKSEDKGTIEIEVDRVIEGVQRDQGHRMIVTSQ